jgi:hypothetical protein
MLRFGASPEYPTGERESHSQAVPEAKQPEDTAT